MDPVVSESPQKFTHLTIASLSDAVVYMACSAMACGHEQRSRRVTEDGDSDKDIEAYQSVHTEGAKVTPRHWVSIVLASSSNYCGLHTQTIFGFPVPASLGAFVGFTGIKQPQ